MELTAAESARFWKSVDKSSDCWLWTASTARNGYGAIQLRGKLWSAHRLSFLVHHGHVPDGMEVCHSCDVKSCVNPKHLQAKTHVQNMADAKARNLLKRGRGRAILNDQQVVEIFLSSEPHKVVAAKYRISAASVFNIRKRNQWQILTAGLPDPCYLRLPRTAASTPRNTAPEIR